MTDTKHSPNYLLFAIRALGLTLTSIVLAPIYIVLRKFTRNPVKKHRVHYRMMHLWGTMCSAIVGYKINITGNFPKNETVFVACNHMGYADIIALSKIIPIYFVSKAEVEDWPLIGKLANLVNTIMISRKRDKALSDIKNTVKERLDSQGNVLVFLEGQSTDGSSVLPFRSPLLQAPIDANSRVVPISLIWSTDNPKLNMSEDIAYWRDEQNFMKHMVRHLGKNSKNLEVVIGDPIDIKEHNRKTLAKYAHEQVVGMRQSLV